MWTQVYKQKRVYVCVWGGGGGGGGGVRGELSRTRLISIYLTAVQKSALCVPLCFSLADSFLDPMV